MDYPTILSLGVGAVGLVGVIAALRGISSVHRDRLILERSREHVDDLSRVQIGADSAEQWFTRHAIPEDSHVADQVLAFLGGWRSGRLPTLGELHNLASRRERNRAAGRAAAGIAATLLICGIAGTLLAIHPVLQGFSIPVSSDGTPVEASTGAIRVTEMIQALGTAFLPSLAALGLTLLVVFLRGVYGFKANRLSHALDRFAFAHLFPRFKLRSFAEDFAKVENKLMVLVDAVLTRDQRFERSITALQETTDTFKETSSTLRGTVDAVARATENLACDTNALLTGLSENLGPDSLFEKTMASSAAAMEKVALEAAKLVVTTKAIEKQHQQLGLALERDAQSIEQSINTIAGQVAKGVASGKEIIFDAAKGVVEDVARAARARVTKEVEPIVVDLGTSGRKVAAHVEKLSRDVDAITATITGSAEAAASNLSNTANAITARVQEGVANAGTSLKDAAVTADAVLNRASKGLESSAEQSSQLMHRIINQFTEASETFKTDVKAEAETIRQELVVVVGAAAANVRAAGETVVEAEDSVRRLLEFAPRTRGPAKRNFIQKMMWWKKY